MGTMNAFYVRNVTEDALSAVRDTFSWIEIETTSEFICVILSRDAEIPKQTLMDLSSRLETEVMWLSFQSVVDAFEYYHWQAGHLLRGLIYGCYSQERTWEYVEGQAEAWERTAFFKPDDLADMLEEAESDEEKAQLEQSWRTGELVVGQMEPYVDARESAREVAIYYQFPGWGLSAPILREVADEADDSMGQGTHEGQGQSRNLRLPGTAPTKARQMSLGYFLSTIRLKLKGKGGS